MISFVFCLLSEERFASHNFGILYVLGADSFTATINFSDGETEINYMNVDEYYLDVLLDGIVEATTIQITAIVDGDPVDVVKDIYVMDVTYQPPGVPPVARQFQCSVVVSFNGVYPDDPPAQN